MSVFEVTRDDHSKGLRRKRSAKTTGALSVASDSPAAESELDPDAYISRYLRSSLAYSGDATSSLKRNAAVCREIVLLDQLKETMIRSRLAAGILLVPEEVTFPPDEDVPEDPAMTDTDRFIETLIEHLAAPKEDPGSPASITPLVVRVPADYIKEWKLLPLTDGILDLEAVERARTAALRRLAGGIDLPLERMEGLGSTNHWSAAAIDQDEVRKHIIPLGDRLARFFTVSYFRRMLIDFEDMSEEDAERFRLDYDASEILTRMDAAASADSLHKDDLISDDARIEAHGFDPDQVRPSEEERWRRLIERLAVVPDKGNRPLLRALIDFEQLDGLDSDVIEAFLDTVAPQTPTPEPVTEPPDGPPTVPAGEPPVTSDPIPGGGDTPAGGEPDPSELAFLERVRATASAELDEVLCRAGTKVMNLSKKLPSEGAARSQVDQAAYRSSRARRPEVLQALARDDWAAIGRTPEALVAGEFDDLQRKLTGWFHGWFARTVDTRTADRQARAAAGQIVDHLDRLALEAFCRSLPREDGMSVPMAVVADAARRDPVPV